MDLFFSFIVPVYNRPTEVRELLESFTQLDTKNISYEILIIEDGSTERSEILVKQFTNQLPIRYYYKPNSGPGASRNYGMKQAAGNYFIILDSDVLLPSFYLQEVRAGLQRNYTDCFGGPDAAHKSFTPLQKAINFTMTSFITTGGIRGNKKSVENYKPRSFNMGISKKAFLKTGGYAPLKVGEDLDLSIRIEKAGFKTSYIAQALVYHKRRTNWRAFYLQVSKFGMGRPILTYLYPQTSTPLAAFPTLFILGFLVSLLFTFLNFYIFILLYLFYFLLIFVSSSYHYKSIKIGIYSVFALIIQFTGYGLGYLKSTYYIHILKKKPRDAFPELFFD